MDYGPPMDAMTRHVRALPEPFWMCREAAEMLGVSKRYLHALAANYPDTLGPGHVTWFGERLVTLYDDEDIAAIRVHLSERDRTPLWTVAEQNDRHRRQVSAAYHDRHAERQAGVDEARAREHREQALALREQLRAEAIERRSLRRARD